MTVFVNWSFPATGTSVTRTLPDRLADYYNVKDFGAIGDNNAAHDTQDTNGIQAAINACIAGGGGTVYLPQGSYLVRSPITCGSDTSDVGVKIIGTGKAGTTIFASGNYTDPNGVGAIIAAGPVGSLPTYDCIESIQGIGGLNCRCTRAGVSIIDCLFGGFGADDQIAVDVSFADGATVMDCNVGATYTGTPDQVTPLEQCLYPNSVCLAMGSGVVTACRGGNGAGICIAISGKGAFVVGNSFEVCNIAYKIGWGPTTIGAACSSKAAYGTVIGALQTERVNIGIDIYDATACMISGVEHGGGFNAQGTGQDIIGATWGGSPATATMETSGNHNLPVGTTKLVLNTAGGTGNDAWKPDNGTTGTGWILATRVDATHFSYPLASDPGTFNFPTSPTTQWGYPMQHGLRFRKAIDCFVTGTFLTAVSLASLDFDYDGDVNAFHNNNTMIGFLAATGVVMPTIAGNRAGWKFSQTGLDALGVTSIFGDTSATVSGVTQFADLPGETGVNQSGPYEGMEYSIIDSPTAASGNFSAAVSVGGGANNVKLRYDGTDWRISG